MQSAAGAPVTGPAPAAPESVSNPFAFKLRQAMAEAEAEIAALRAEERRLREDFTTYQRRVENTPLREQEFQELSRDYETTGELYRTLLKRYEEAQLAETLEQRQKGEQFRILEMATSAECSLGSEPDALVPGGSGAVRRSRGRVGVLLVGAAGQIVPRRRRPAEAWPASGWSRGFPGSSATETRRADGGALVAWACMTALAVMVLTLAAAYATATRARPDRERRRQGCS